MLTTAQQAASSTLVVRVADIDSEQTSKQNIYIGEERLVNHHEEVFGVQEIR